MAPRSQPERLPLARSEAGSEEIRRTLGGFCIDGELQEMRPFERGHIHDTYISSWRAGDTTVRYLHQKLNVVVFEDIPGLMHNIELVTDHLDQRIGEAERAAFQTLRLVPTKAATSYLRDDRGGFWRTYRFIENTTSYDVCQSESAAHEAARVFGRFQALLHDIEVERLRETIPRFFSSPWRLQQLQAAIAQDAVGRRATAASEIEFALEKRDLVAVIDDALRDGRFPVRVVHGDTKLNNVLFSTETGRAVAVVDLDTCMPAYSLYDFGDLVRFTAARHAEDERDLSKVGIDLNLFAALVHGYLEHAAQFLTLVERELMPFAARLVTLTIGMRFLTDYLSGDVYFKTAREGHNLDRCRTQFRMVEVMEACDADMRQIAS